MAHCPECNFTAKTFTKFHAHCMKTGHNIDPDEKCPIIPEEWTDPDWGAECETCGQSPVVPVTGLCGPCTFGEASTINGNW